jgi:2-methylisocitrate lyase-like PEP mutase family enzyme
MNQAEKANAFRSLHAGPRILVLPNAWDPVTARLFAGLGFPAVATTSAAVAWALDRPDGEHLLREEMTVAVEKIAAAIDVPLTADMEAGYGATPAEVAETIHQVVAAGAVGVNLEDGTPDPARPLRDVLDQVTRLRAARAAAEEAGLDLFINARTDVYLRRAGDPAGRFEATVERGLAYLEAGGDSIFVPGLADIDTIGRLAAAIPGPLNVILLDGTPPVAELEQAGVRRLSTGPRLAAAALGLAQMAAETLLESGTYDEIFKYALPSREIQGLFEPSA